ncbi:zf-HC2 domain-containing protein [Pelagibius sp. CAU 1746]|uniref:anti-sigma factor family protein n=1 Tax=Pelagibius sp. CAU 1746 TaxID=3140370 RepID=UPI00325BE498
MVCDKALLVEAYIDGEVDAAAAVDVERHLVSCAACAARLDGGKALREALRREAPYYRAPAHLRRSLAARYGLGAAPPKPAPFRAAPLRPPGLLAGALGGAASMLAVAALAFVLLVPSRGDLLVEDVAAAHMRSLMPGHLLDVESTDRHTVKPWFDGRVDVAPPLGDFPDAGFELAGGRLDYVDGRAVAAIVYRRDKHVINLFAWADDDSRLPAASTRNGYHFLFWRAEGLIFCAVSDVAARDLLDLKALTAQAAASQQRE